MNFSAIFSPQTHRSFPATLALCSLGLLFYGEETTAQSITTSPDGTGTVININGNTYDIKGGTRAGENLFHSFSEFNLNPNEIANFLSNPEIRNIVGRVTGGNPSVIQGLIQMSGGSSNLYLMNPAGWIFTDGASLNVPASFGVTTATRMGFGDNFFNAYGKNNYAELTGNPTHLIFDQNHPSLIFNEADLAVSNGENLWMVGGSVVSTGTITAENGNITLAAIPGQNQVKLSQEGMILDLVLEATPVQGGINLPEGVTGLRAVDIPKYLTGGSPQNSKDTIAVDEQGNATLANADTPIQTGDTVIAGNLTADEITLMAAERVKPTDYDLVSSHPTVVLFPKTDQDSLSYTFIDERTDNPYELLYGGDSGTISRLIDRQENGLTAVNEAVEEVNRPLDAINIVAEGNQGEFWLGNTYLTANTLSDYQQQLQSIGENLTPTGDILLYSCLTALGARGQAFVENLATLTDADVAASTDVTGSAQYQGNWQLEYNTGHIEATTPFTFGTVANWEGKLATRTVQNVADSGEGSLRDGLTGMGGSDSYWSTGVTAGDEITFAVSGQIDLSSQIVWSQENLTLDGTGQTIVLDGGDNNRIFQITADQATLREVTIQNGSASEQGGGIYHRGNGTLTVENSSITENVTEDHGGGIHSKGDLLLRNSTIGENSATLSGGGIRVQGDAEIHHSQLVDNQAGDDGGGIRSNQDLTLTDTLVSGNQSGARGGGIYGRQGTITGENVTIRENEAAQDGGGIRAKVVALTGSQVLENEAGNNGGGIHTNQDITLIETTVAENRAVEEGGGISSRQGDVTLERVVIGQNRAGEDGGGMSLNSPDSRLTIDDSQITGNSAQTHGGGVQSQGEAFISNSQIASNFAAQSGGGIRIQGNVEFTNTQILDNSAIDNGGGIRSNQDLTLTDSTVSGNRTDSNGGGIYGRQGTVSLTNSTVSNNAAEGDGGGLRIQRSLHLTDSTISENTAGGRGGGLGKFGGQGTINLSNSTVSSNSAGHYGGGIYSKRGPSDESGEITNSTIAFNASASEGGGIFRHGGVFQFRNNIIAQNEDVGGESPDLGDAKSNPFDGSSFDNNLIGDTTGVENFNFASTNLLNTDPQLLPLGHYGGETQTHGLRPGSPALNTGDNQFASAADQRGAERRLDGTVDMGAFESAGFELVPQVSTVQTANAGMTFNVTVQVVEKAFQQPVPLSGVSVNFQPWESVQGTLTHGTTVETNEQGVAVNGFFLKQGSGQFPLLVSGTAFNEVAFNLAVLPEETSSQTSTITSSLERVDSRIAFSGSSPLLSVSEETTDSFVLSFSPRTTEEEEQVPLMGNACQSPHYVLVADEEERGDDDAEEGIFAEVPYQRHCRPIREEYRGWRVVQFTDVEFDHGEFNPVESEQFLSSK